MSEKNLPILMISPKESDIKKDNGGGTIEFFDEVTPELQADIINKFESVLEYYDDVFKEDDKTPAVGKITVKSKAIAKSHKPNDFCRNCPIIGGKNLDEIYIRVSKKSIEETVSLIKSPPSEKFKANLTAISDIEPILADEKISDELAIISSQGNFDDVKDRIKIKLFDFNNTHDNDQISKYVKKKFEEFGFSEEYDTITYGEQIKYIKIRVNSYDDIIKIASINGIQSIDFFQRYAISTNEFIENDMQKFLNNNQSNSEITIGIIDGGMSDENPYLRPYVIAREEYVSKQYQNTYHATFIASTIQYGNELNGLVTTSSKRYKFIDIVAVPNGNKEYGPTIILVKMNLWKSSKNRWKNMLHQHKYGIYHWVWKTGYATNPYQIWGFFWITYKTNMVYSFLYQVATLALFHLLNGQLQKTCRRSIE